MINLVGLKHFVTEPSTFVINLILLKPFVTQLRTFVINLTPDFTFVINLILLKHSVTRTISDLSDLAQKQYFGDKLGTFEAFVTQLWYT